MYPDDILVANHSGEQRSAHSCAFLGFLGKHGATIKASKGELVKLSVTFSDQIVWSSGGAPETKRVTVILDHPEPHSYRQLQQFVGFASLCRRSIESFSMRFQSAATIRV